VPQRSAPAWTGRRGRPATDLSPAHVADYLRDHFDLPPPEARGPGKRGAGSTSRQITRPQSPH